MLEYANCVVGVTGVQKLVFDLLEVLRCCVDVRRNCDGFCADGGRIRFSQGFEYSVCRDFVHWCCSGLVDV